MNHFFWINHDRVKKLIEAGFKELPCQTDDREALSVNIENKTFEIVHKHVNSNFNTYLDDIDVLINIDSSANRQKLLDTYTEKLVKEKEILERMHKSNEDPLDIEYASNNFNLVNKFVQEQKKEIN